MNHLTYYCTPYIWSPKEADDHFFANKLVIKGGRWSFAERQMKGHRYRGFGHNGGPSVWLVVAWKWFEATRLVFIQVNAQPACADLHCPCFPHWPSINNMKKAQLLREMLSLIYLSRICCCVVQQNVFCVPVHIRYLRSDTAIEICKMSISYF